MSIEHLDSAVQRVPTFALKMISVTYILIAAAMFVFYNYFFKGDKRMKKLPPGPRGLPLIGSTYQLGKMPYRMYAKWLNEYGKIFLVNAGFGQKAIIISDPKMIRALFNEQVSAGRPIPEFLLKVTGGNYGIVNAEEQTWEEQRRYTLRHLRDFGFGKNSMELLICEEVRETIEWMKSEEGHPVSVNRRFSLAVLNSLWRIVSGKRFDQNDSTLNDLLTKGNQAFNDTFARGIAVFFPKLAPFLPELSGLRNFEMAFKNIGNFIAKEVKFHKDNSNTTDAASDFMHAYLGEMRITSDPHSSFYGEAGEKNLLGIVSDLFTAGSDTTANTLSWAILYLMRNPKVQSQLHKEIDNVVGQSRSPTLKDRPIMPYTEAMINEVLRISSLAPVGVPHRLLADTEHSGYFLPKGATVFANLHAIHHDKEVWGDPENFRPERFLKDGKLMNKPDSFMPFLAGKRACLGEPLARDTLFLFLTGIFQRFQILPDPANPQPTFEPLDGFTLQPKPFTIVMKDRIDC